MSLTSSSDLVDQRLHGVQGWKERQPGPSPSLGSDFFMFSHFRQLPPGRKGPGASKLAFRVIHVLLIAAVMTTGRQES